MPEDVQSADAFGPNAWLVDDMYEQYRRDPASVSESWQEFFSDYRRDWPAPRPAPAPRPPIDGDGSTVRILRGAAARVAANMEASLALPTA
ncbi:MAG: 2-oxoglutarate dehydrogenase E1 subunit family protein, partial [Acidimicrobiales bacterium]